MYSMSREIPFVSLTENEVYTFGLLHEKVARSKKEKIKSFIALFILYEVKLDSVSLNLP